MFVGEGSAPGPATPTRERGGRCRPGGQHAHNRHTATPPVAGGVLAREERVGYDPGRDHDGNASAGTPWTDDPTDSADTDSGQRGWVVGRAPRAVQARTRVARCATTPGSVLGAAVGALAGAVDALAVTATADMAGAGAPDGADAGGTADAGGATQGGEGAGGTAAGPDPGLAAEHVDVVGDALVALAYLRARLDACQLGLLADFERRGGHCADGAVTASSWLAGRTGTDYSTTARQVSTARRLGGLPRLAAHLAAGDITLSHVSAVTDRCVPARADTFADAEAILADLAATSPPRHVRHAVARLVDLDDPDHAHTPDAPGGDALRELRLRAGFQGRGELVGTLDPLTREALTVLLDAFDTPDAPRTPADQRRTPTQRRHDAFAAMLHTLLAQPGLPTVQGARPQILITIDLAALLGLPPDHPAAAITLGDLADWLGIDLPGLTHTPAPHHTDTEPADTAEPPADTDEPPADSPAPDADDTAGESADDAAAADPAPDATGDTADSPADDATDDADDAAPGSTADPGHGPGADPAAGGSHPAAGAAHPDTAGQPDAHPADGPAPDPAQALPTDPDPPPPAPPPRPRPPPAPPPRPRPPRFGSGVALSPATVRGLAPAATIMAVLTLGPWRAVNVGAKHRTLPAWLRTVLTTFHVHCRGADCDRPAAWTQAHHVTPWTTTHTTDLNDTLPLCPPHHDLMDIGWDTTLNHTTGTVTWTSPTGRTITVPPPDPWP